ncbi:MAG: choice-of-anchor Q domain-containing protein [Actinomycetes bacterium]
MKQNLGAPHSRARSATSLALSGSMLTAGAGVGTLASVLFIGLASPAGAATFTVSNLNDSGAGSLRQAITDANVASGADTIDFGPGVTGTITLGSDFPQITESLTIVGPGSDALTLSGAGSHHVFSLDTGGNGTVSLSGVTVTNSVGAAGTGDGGAIDAVNTNVILDEVVLTNNAIDTNQASGGALSVKNLAGAGNVSITNSALSHNSARSAPGGETKSGGAFLTADDITIASTRIDHNDADFVGGLVAYANNVLTMTNTTIADNSGAAVVGGLATSAATTIISDSVITGNTSTGSVGGAYILGFSFANYGVGTVAITTTRISNNTGSVVGGAFIEAGGSPVGSDQDANIFDRLTVTDNISTNTSGTSTAVGGLVVSMIGKATIANSTISNNSGIGLNLLGSSIAPGSVPASLSSSAISAPHELTLSHSTVSGNSRQGISAGISLYTASTPSAVAPGFDGTLTLNHALVAGNGIEDVAIPATAVFSLIQKPNSSLIIGTGTLTGVDPDLKPLESISPTVSVVPITIGSAAWNAGNPNFLPPPATDQRGMPRVVDIIDIGAYEIQEPFILPRFTG